jgi:hypothetical protein
VRTLGKRPLVLAASAACLVVGVIPAARAGTSTDPEVKDMAGDANVVSTYRSAAAVPPASVAGFDIVSAWFGGGKVSLRLAAAPADVGIFLVGFDAPGCTLADPAPGPVTLPVQVLDAHPTRGVGLILNRQGGTASQVAYYQCNVANNTWGAVQVPVQVVGDTITWTIPAGGHIGPGTAASKPYAITAATPFNFVDITDTGRNGTI